MKMNRNSFDTLLLIRFPYLKFSENFFACNLITTERQKCKLLSSAKLAVLLQIFGPFTSQVGKNRKIFETVTQDMENNPLSVVEVVSYKVNTV